MPDRRHVLASLAAALASAPLQAQTTPFPSRMVRIVPFGTAGGPIDGIARAYADKLQARWGQSVIVEAKPGASGIVATDFVAKSPPDGYTVMFTLPLTHINVPILQKVPYDPVRDFTPLSMLATGGPMLVVRADAPFGDVKGFIEFAKAQGRPLNYGTWGNGSTAHLFGELLKRQSGAQLTHVPYKAEAAVHNDLFGNTLDFAWANPATARGHVQAGKMKVLAHRRHAPRVDHADGADLHRAGLRRLRHRQLDRRLRAGQAVAGHPGHLGDGAARDHRDAGRRTAADRLRLRAAGQHAGAVCRALPGRLPAYGRADQGGRRHRGLKRQR